MILANLLNGHLQLLIKKNMKKPEEQQSFESGSKVWYSISDQAFELVGFIQSATAALLRFIGSHFLSLVLAMVLGAALAFAWWYTVPKVFYSEMTVSYQHYEKKIYADMLDKLDQLIQSDDIAALATQLNLPEEIIEKLVSIKSFNIRKEPLLQDLSTERIPFYIQVGTNDPTIFQQLQPAIVHYLDDTEFIRQRIEFMKMQNLEKLQFYENRIGFMDSVSSLMIAHSQLNQKEDPEVIMNLHTESVKLFERINELKGALQFNVNIEVLDGFVPGSRPDMPSLFVFLFYGIFFGLAGRLAALLLLGV